MEPVTASMVLTLMSVASAMSLSSSRWTWLNFKTLKIKLVKFPCSNFSIIKKPDLVSARMRDKAREDGHEKATALNRKKPQNTKLTTEDAEPWKEINQLNKLQSNLSIINLQTHTINWHHKCKSECAHAETHKPKLAQQKSKHTSTHQIWEQHWRDKNLQTHWRNKS